MNVFDVFEEFQPDAHIVSQIRDLDIERMTASSAGVITVYANSRDMIPFTVLQRLAQCLEEQVFADSGPHSGPFCVHRRRE